MITILVKFYNQLIRKEYYPKRWLRVLDVMLEREETYAWKTVDYSTNRSRYAVIDKNIFRIAFKF